jgi:glycosyltransferase involved in cell wall biosynthesis
MTRILYVAADPALTFDQQGGAGTHMRGTIEGLERLGFDVEPAIGGAGASWKATAAQRPAPVLRRVAPEGARAVGRELRLLAHGRSFRLADLGEFDVVYERSAYLLDPGLRLARQHRTPYVLEVDGILVEARRAAYGAPLHSWAERIERRKVGEADLVVVMSDASGSEVSARYGLARDRILVKGLGVERELLDRNPPNAPDVDVGWAGTFQPYHGVDLLITALRRLPARSAELIGDGPGRQAAELASVGLEIEFPGLLSRATVLERLERCAVLVISDSAEAVYPIKLLEYAALRRPVVAPNRPAFGEFRSPAGDLIHLFEPGDPEDLARALDEALGEPDDRADRLHDLVAREYTWDAVAERLGSAFRELLSQ